MPLFTGVDFGTSGCRVCVIDQHRTPVFWHSLRLPAPQRDSDCSVQNPDIWWEALLSLLSAVAESIDSDDLVSIAIDGTSSSLLICDADGAPLHDALMYDDRRAGPQTELFARLAPTDSAVHSPSSSLAKLLWLLGKPLKTRASHALHQAEWLSNRLCGQYGTGDENNALKLGYDAVNRRWPEWLREMEGVAAVLPEVVPPGSQIGQLRTEIAAKTGLPAGVRVIAGTTDSTAAFIATGANRPGDAVTSLGTTMVMKSISPVPVFSREHGLYSHRLGDLWLAGGASNSGGGVFRQFFCEGELQALTERLAPEIPTGLEYYPLPATGERFPHNDPGLEPRLSPRPADDAVFFQGMLEGMASIERQAYESLKAHGVPFPTRVLSAGGGARNRPWRKIRERTLGVPVLLATQDEAAYGAALLAASERT